MPRRPDMPCAGCGNLMWRTDTSLPEGQARCRPCRREHRASDPRPNKPKGSPCPICGELKWSKGDRPCRQCDKVGSRKPRPCEICDQVYKPTHSLQRTCGRECGKWLNHKLSCPVDWMTCGVCGEPYVKRAGRGFGTCSPECAEEARHILFTPSVVKDDGWKYEDRECVRCGTAFRLIDRGIYMAPQTTHCSNRCARKTSKLRRKVREHGSNGEWRWSDFMRIARKFNYCCAYCGEKPERLDPDHVIPLARGGPNTSTNLLPACPPCNSDKTDYLLTEWAERRASTGKPPRHTSWAEEDPRYFHLTAVRSSVEPRSRRSAA